MKFHKAIDAFFSDLPATRYVPPTGLLLTLRDEIKAGRPTIMTLQAIAMDMEHHLSLKQRAIIHLVNEEANKAGYIEIHSESFNEISVCHNTVYDENQYLAILAHEISHEYQFSLSMQNLFPPDDQELFTDFLTFYLGFGELTKNGKYAKRVDKRILPDGRIETITKTASIGYLDESDFSYGDYCVSRLRKERG